MSSEDDFSLSQKALSWLEEWNHEPKLASNLSSTVQKAVEILVETPGMTMAHSRDFKRAVTIFTLRDGTAVKIFINPVRVKHIFLADTNDKIIFGGYVGWIHTEALNKVIKKIKNDFT